jgi:hypothetical protein
VKDKTKRWDANWDRLRIETKVEKLREFMNRTYKETKDGISSANASASTALYVANKNR